MHDTGLFDLLACFDHDPASISTLAAARSSDMLGSARTKITQHDLATLSRTDLRSLLCGERVDMVTGGPPCQSFSTVGRRGSISDPRGQLIFRFLDLAAALDPKVIVMENVAGLLSAALPGEGRGSVLECWAQALLALGSDWRADLFRVNCVNYGAPQVRERIIIIANRIGAVARWPQMTHGPGREPWVTLADALARVHSDDGSLLDFSPRKLEYLRMIPPGSNWRSLPEDIARESMGRAYHAKGGRSGWWRRLSADRPCPTILTMPNHASTSLCHPTETRALTIAECAAIQEFPDGWPFQGTVLERYRQIGNAVPVRLAACAARAAAGVLNEQGEHAEPPTPRFTITEYEPHVRVKRWKSV